MPEVMGVYLKHPESLTIYSSPYLDRILYLNNLVAVYDEFLTFYKGKYNNIIRTKLTDIHLELWSMHKMKGESLKAKENYKLALGKKNDLVSFSSIYLKYYSAIVRHSLFLFYHRVRRAIRQSVKKIVKN